MPWPTLHPQSTRSFPNIPWSQNMKMFVENLRNLGSQNASDLIDLRTRTLRISAPKDLKATRNVKSGTQKPGRSQDLSFEKLSFNFRLQLPEKLNLSFLLAHVYISSYIFLHFYICLCVFAYFLSVFVCIFKFIHVKLID